MIWLLPLPAAFAFALVSGRYCGYSSIYCSVGSKRRSVSRGGMALASLMLSVIVLVLTLCNFALGAYLGGR